MKTSNKILLGGFIVVIIMLTYTNLRMKRVVNQIREKQELYEDDTIKSDSTSIQININ
ncbi:MAG: hypothetical protein PHH37_00045 [Paludibacter sp.]|nr:hypothetical protein [Paludibacter sp.]